MTDGARPEASRETPPQRTLATVHQSRWPPWIWAVPIAAVGLVAWLVMRRLEDHEIVVAVAFDDAASIAPNSTRVHYRGVDVGEVRGVRLSEDTRRAVAELGIDHTLEAYLTTGTRFYLEAGSSPRFPDLSSLKAVVSGPNIEIVPGGGPPARHFDGLSGSPPENLTVSVPYLVRFEGAVGGLATGSQVTFRGFDVGQVAHVDLGVDASTGQVEAPVLIHLDPTRFHIRGDDQQRDWTARTNAMLDRMVQQHLRARLAQSPPLIGSWRIELAFVPTAGDATLKTDGRYPEIPTTESADLDDLEQKLARLPLDDIANNLRDITARVKALAESPQMQDGVAHLDHAMAELDRTMQQTGPQVAPTLESIRKTVDALRGTAGEIDTTVVAARRMMGGGAGSPDGNLQDAVRELTEAARAVRNLADHLDQHPESLIRGR